MQVKNEQPNQNNTHEQFKDIAQTFRYVMEQPEINDPGNLDSLEPDYTHHCIVCGDQPVVIGIKDGAEVMTSKMCGSCTFGEAACIDPGEWQA